MEFVYIMYKKKEKEVADGVVRSEIDGTVTLGGALSGTGCGIPGHVLSVRREGNGIWAVDVPGAGHLTSPRIGKALDLGDGVISVAVTLSMKIEL